MTSDGTPWRPFVHLLDVAAAVSCVLDAPRELVHGEIFNVGSSTLELPDPPDRRDRRRPRAGMRAQLRRLERRQAQLPDRLHARSRRRLPGFACQWDVERGVAELLDVFARIGLDEPTYRWRGYTRLDQIRHLLDTAQIDDDLFWTNRG